MFSTGWFLITFSSSQNFSLSNVVWFIPATLSMQSWLSTDHRVDGSISSYCPHLPFHLKAKLVTMININFETSACCHCHCVHVALLTLAFSSDHQSAFAQPWRAASMAADSQSVYSSYPRDDFPFSLFLYNHKLIHRVSIILLHWNSTAN